MHLGHGSSSFMLACLLLLTTILYILLWGVNPWISSYGYGGVCSNPPSPPLPPPGVEKLRSHFRYDSIANGFKLVNPIGIPITHSTQRGFNRPPARAAMV